jgi:hypothetical protein
MTAEITSTLVADVTAVIVKAMEQTKSGTNIGDSQHVENVENITNNIKQDLDTTIDQTVGNILTGVVSGSSEEDIKFNGKVTSDAGCNITQKSVVESIVDQISETVISTLIENKMTIAILDEYDLTIKQDNKGFDFNQFFKDIFDGINNLFGNFMDNFSPGGIISKLVVPIVIAVCIGLVMTAAVGITKAIKNKDEDSEDLLDTTGTQTNVPEFNPELGNTTNFQPPPPPPPVESMYF